VFLDQSQTLENAFCQIVNVLKVIPAKECKLSGNKVSFLLPEFRPG